MIRKRFRSQTGPLAARSLAKSISAFLGQEIADPDLLYELELAITEACANIYVHAYKSAPGGEIQIEVTLQPGQRLTLTIMDWGRPYLGPAGTNPLPPEPDQENGRGLYLIAQIMDTFQFIQSQDTNMLYLEKNIEERS